jgi:hypothetical protein
VDRTGTCTGPFKTAILPEHKLNFFQPKDVDLEQVLYTRAEEIISFNKKIFLAWSGGIDSTLCLLSLISAGVKKDQLVIAMNNDGIRENPFFYKKFILPNFKLISSEKFSQLLKYNSMDGIFINGDPADALLGIDFAVSIYKKFGSEFLSLPCSRKNITEYFRSMKMNEQASNCWFDFFISSKDRSSRALETVYDFSWWCTFNHRWQTANEKIRTRYEKDVNYIKFFNTDEFVYWASTYPLTEIKKYSDFKKPFKEIIFKFDSNLEYYEKKIKLESVSNNVLTGNFSAVLNDSSRLSFEEFNLEDFYQKDNFFADWLSSN